MSGVILLMLMNFNDVFFRFLFYSILIFQSIYISNFKNSFLPRVAANIEPLEQAGLCIRYDCPFS